MKFGGKDFSADRRRNAPSFTERFKAATKRLQFSTRSKNWHGQGKSFAMHHAIVYISWWHEEVDVIEQIREKIQQRQYEYSRHAVDQSILREISEVEMQEAIMNGEIIEDYPNDKYGPSCLIAGQTPYQRWIHVQTSYPSRPKVKIITLYQPNPDEWIDFKARKPK